MAWKPRFWYSRKIAPGIRLNFSKTGMSVTFGPRGLKLTVGHGRVRKTVGLPGTGLWFSETTPLTASSVEPRHRSTTSGTRARSGYRLGSPPPRRVAPIAAPVITPHDGDGDGVIEACDAPVHLAGSPWRLPSLDLLDPTPAESAAAARAVAAFHARNAEIIARKLASFDIDVAVVGHSKGLAVARYEVVAAPRVPVSRIEALADDLQMALAARTIRIEAPIPGQSTLGIEIPTFALNVVGLREVLEASILVRPGRRLQVALGQDVAGRPVAADLALLPHLLVAGSPGSGKSVMLNTLVTSLLCTTTPDEVRLILVDLTRVESVAYADIPHLLVPVIAETDRALAALTWCVEEVERRLRRLAGVGARNIETYNETRIDPEDRLPRIVVVIDELADLMLSDGRVFEERLVRLGQRARATGIHLVLATRRPSADVVTESIRANVPGRIAFVTASPMDSVTILDTAGAETLAGRGDMLFRAADGPRPIRLQGAFTSDAEISRVADHWRSQLAGPIRYEDVSVAPSSTVAARGSDDDDADRLLPEAVAVIQEFDRASASLLQRRLKVGYARAARIIDQLEARGYVGAFDGANAREVFRRDDSASDENTPDDES